MARSMKIGEGAPLVAPLWGFLPPAGAQTQGFARSSLHPGLACCGPLALGGMPSELNFRVRTPYPVRGPTRQEYGILMVRVDGRVEPGSANLPIGIRKNRRSRPVNLGLRHRDEANRGSPARQPPLFPSSSSEIAGPGETRSTLRFQDRTQRG
jgi:hypothetical protein